MTTTASILAVGSELLGTTRLDTNSLFLTAGLEGLGYRVVRKACVGDPWDDLLAELRIALDRTQLVVVTGGLGPTEPSPKPPPAPVLRRGHRDRLLTKRPLP